ncbi:hypothetical protein AAG604_04415 [Citromicrobium bathyomarinum]
MSEKIDSKDWTGDYSTVGHYPLATDQERRVQRRVIKYSLAFAFLLVGGLSIWQVFA